MMLGYPTPMPNVPPTSKNPKQPNSTRGQCGNSKRKVKRGKKR